MGERKEYDRNGRKMIGKEKRRKEKDRRREGAEGKWDKSS